MNGGGVIFFLVIVIGLVGIYFIPTIVANMQKSPHIGAIAVINLLLGWTLVGWVGALVWALADDQVDRTKSREMVTAQFSTRVETMGWCGIAVGQPVKVVAMDAEASAWSVIAENGPIGQIAGDKARQIKFRSEAAGPARARITGVWRNRDAGTVANIAITFG